MIVLLIAIWCIVGTLCLMWVFYSDFGELTVRDIIVCVLCGASGVFFMIGHLIGSDFFDKRIF